MDSVVDDAVRARQKEERWRAAEDAMTRLCENPDECAEYQAKAKQWDATSADGLEDLPYERPE